ncbi:MAG: hypothetical protein D6737_07940 [Chloroflexi bacterium]|nr:MAG: hypothetical protein D6737_07940 [Chloroflexota bacterium]
MYDHLIAYLNNLYAVDGHTLFTRNGVAYPVVVFPPDEAQTDDVNSVLGHVMADTFIPRETFAIYDEEYLDTMRRAGRRLTNGITYVYTHIDSAPLKIHAQVGRYFDMIMTSDVLSHELKTLFANGAAHNAVVVPRRSRLHRVVTPVEAMHTGHGRSSAIGGIVLTVFNHDGQYKAILARRSTSAGIDAGLYHVQPAFMFQPVGDNPHDAAHWNLVQHIYREYLEELFGMSEADGAGDFSSHPMLRDLQAMRDDGRASLHLTGIALNLLSLRPDICTLLLIRDPEWYTRVSGGEYGLFGRAMRRDVWETDGETVTFAPIDSDAALLGALPGEPHRIFTPPGAAAMWLGVDRARTLLT